MTSGDDGRIEWIVTAIIKSSSVTHTKSKVTRIFCLHQYIGYNNSISMIHMSVSLHRSCYC